MRSGLVKRRRPWCLRACRAPRATGARRRLIALLLAGLATHLVAAQTTEPIRTGDADNPLATPQQLQDLLGAVKQLVAGPAPASVDTEAVEPPAESAPRPATGQVARDDTGRLDVHVRDMPIVTLLEMLSYQARANIVTSTSVSGQVSANLYAVTLDEALDAILTPNHYRYQFVGGTVFVGNKDEIVAMQPPPVTRVFKLRYIRPAEAATLARAVLGQDASVVEGGAGGSASSGGLPELGDMGSAGVDYLIVTDQPDRLAEVERLLAQVDQRPRQVLIEATVLRATLTEANQFGIDFTMLGGIDFQDVNSTSNASADLTTGALPADDLQSTTFNMNTDFSGNITGGGFTFGLIKDSIASFIRALEDVTDVVVVANPKILALNKQQAEVIVGRRDGYITTTVTETAAIQQVEFLETGTQIKFCPVINDDGTVRLFVHPKDSNGGLTAANLPFEETTEAQADVLVDDGNTILIGGLFRERTLSSESQLPLLGDLPVVGLLFGSRSDQTVREEVIILLTAHIVKETQQEQDQYRRLLEDIERIRVGSRYGLLGTGRERLAQAHFHEALRKLEQGDRDGALLNARMTLNNQPKHVPAMKLKERLLNERQWDDEGTRMRTFIWELILPERVPEGASPPPIFGRSEDDPANYAPLDEIDEEAVP